MTATERERLANTFRSQRSLALVVSIAAMFFSFISFFMPPAQEMCLVVFFLSIFSLALSLALFGEGRRIKKALKEGTVLEISSVYDGRSVGPVSVSPGGKVRDAFQVGRPVTVGVVPVAARTVSVNGQPLPKTMPTAVPRDLDRIVRGNVFVWPELTGQTYGASEERTKPVEGAPVKGAAGPKKRKQAKYCPYHGSRAEIRDGGAWCSECNAAVDPPPKFCPYHGCRTVIEDGQATCPRCDGPVEAV
jgi:nitrite reductase/ring-hydroxylating ferredoxin subunit